MTKLAFRHGAYLIEPTPHHLNGVGPWTQWLQIARAEPGGGWRVQLFNDAATFPTHAAVVAPASNWGATSSAVGIGTRGPLLLNGFQFCGGLPYRESVVFPTP